MQFSFNKYSLDFVDGEVENQFRNFSIKKVLSKVRGAILFGGIMLSLFVAYDWLYNPNFPVATRNKLLVVSLIVFSLYFVFRTKVVLPWYKHLLALLFVIAMYAAILGVSHDVSFLFMFYVIVVLFTLIPFVTIRAVIIMDTVLIAVYFYLLYKYSSNSSDDLIKHMGLFLAFIGTTFLVFINQYKIERKSFAKTAQIEEKNNKLENERIHLLNQAALASILKNANDTNLDLKSFLEESLRVVLNLPWLNIVNKGSIFITNSDGNLDMFVDKDLGVLRKTCATIKPEQCLCGKALSRKKLLFNHCVTADHDIRPEGMTPHGHYNIPMMLNDKVIGVLNLYVDHNHQKTENEVEFLTLIANSLGSVIYRTQLEDQALKQTIELKRYFAAIEQSEESIVFVDKKGRLKYANPYFFVQTGYTLDEVIGKNMRFLSSGKTPKNDIENLWETIQNKQTWKGEFINIKKNGEEFIERATITPILGDNGEIVEYISMKSDITDQKKQVKKIIDQNKIIEESYRNIQDSIEYAQRIQNSLLHANRLLFDKFENANVFFLPKETVSGDFYLVREKKDKIYIAVADCTGHGVPGALVSALASQELNHLIATLDGTTGEILDAFNKNLNQLLNNDDEIGSDGVDLTLACIDQKNKEIQYSGAKGFFFICQDEELVRLKTDRMSIGQDFKDSFAFESRTIKYSPNDVLHFYSDGLVDQFSKKTNKRIGSKAVKEFIKANSRNNKKNIEKEFHRFMNSHMTELQTDDIIYLTLKLC